MRVGEREGGFGGRAVDRAGAGAGAALGWVLRVCFCQAADGAGMSVGCGAGGARGWDWMGGGGGGGGPVRVARRGTRERGGFGWCWYCVGFALGGLEIGLIHGGFLGRIDGSVFLWYSSLFDT